MSRNPFDDDDEPGGWGSTGTSNFSNNHNSWLKNEKAVSGDSHSIQAQLQDSQTRTRASQQRALASIANSERIGVETAAELLEQGEKLTRAEQRLDEIGQLQKDSQRQINTMSSVFGGIKNFFFKKQLSTPVPTSAKPVTPSSTENLRPNSTLRDSIQLKSSWSANVHVQEEVTTGKPADVEFERNLSLMSDGMSRLKGLAQGLNEELRQQNEQLDRMAPRVDSVTGTMTRQNQQMNKLLGVKPK